MKRLIKKILKPIIWLFFYKRKSVFDKKFQKWLFELILSDYVDFRMFHDLNRLDIIPPTWEIKGLDRENYRAKLLDFNIGYLVVSKADDQSFIENLEKWIPNKSKYWIIPSEGFLNIVIFCLGLGFIIEDEQYKIADKIKKNIPDKKLSDIALAFCNGLNKELKDNREQLLTPFEWQKLYTQSQYHERFNNPMEILSYLIYDSNVQVSDLLIKLNPKLRIAALNNLILPKQQYEKDYLTQVINSDNDREIGFLSLLFFRYKDTLPNWMNEELITLFLDKHWESILPYFINQTFGDNIIKIQTPIILEYRRVISSFLISIQESDRLVSILKWPNDWVALSNWIESLHSSESQNELSKSFYCNIAESYFENLDISTKEIFENDLNHKSIINITIKDIGKPSSTFIYSYILLGFINMDIARQENNLSKLKTILFRLKELLYGGYTSNHIAVELIDRFLYLLTCSENLTDLTSEHKTSIIKIRGQIEKIVLYPYVKHRESEGIFWDKNYEPNYYSNLALHYLNEGLKGTNPIITKLKNKINGMSSSSWGN
jgi:hypothetical protein